MLELNNVCVNYKQGKEYVNVLNNISLSINNGDCLSVVGESGCGKTTLLNVISGSMEPICGEVVFNGNSISLYKKHIAVVSQDYGLFPWKTVLENVILPLKLKNDNNMHERANYILKKLGLESVKNSYPNQLSGGQKQRTAIARGLLSDPEIILLDEPFSALDSMMKKELYSMLYSYFKHNNMTVILVTHNIQEAVYFGNKIFVLTSEIRKKFKMIENNTAGIIGSNDGKKMQQNILKTLIGEI